MKLLTIRSRQTYAEAAQNIRAELAKFTTISVIKLVIRKLHEKPRWGTQQIPLPWLLCQILEIAFEITPGKYAKPATTSGINRILQKLFDLQDIAFKSNHRDLMIDFRRVIVSQFRFSGSLTRHAVFMDRFYSILFMQNGKQSFNQAFQKETGLSLETFALLSSYLMAKTIDEEKIFLFYEEMVTDLLGEVEIQDIAGFLRLIGGTVEELQLLVKEVRNQGRAFHASEYFEEPVMISKPVILFSDGLATAHPCVLAIGLSEFVMRLLKEKMPGFKDKFTKLFEQYVKEILDDNGINYTHEKEIQSWYKTPNEAPATDFLLRNGSESLFIDVKGVEPKQAVLTSSDGRLIKDRLKDAHFKAISQISECAKKLEELSIIHGDVEQRYGLIITHQEYYIFDANTLLSYVGDSGTKTIEKLGSCMKGNHILFCTIDDWEKCLAVCVDAGLSVLEFMKFCVSRQQIGASRRFTFEMHVDDFAKENGIRRRLDSNWSSAHRTQMQEKLRNATSSSKMLWKTIKDSIKPGVLTHHCNELKRMCDV